MFEVWFYTLCCILNLKTCIDLDYVNPVNRNDHLLSQVLIVRKIWKAHVSFYAGEYFDKQEIVRRPEENKKIKSKLAMQLENFASSPNNAFIEYAKFDGKVKLWYFNANVYSFKVYKCTDNINLCYVVSFRQQREYLQRR